MAREIAGAGRTRGGTAPRRLGIAALLVVALAWFLPAAAARATQDARTEREPVRVDLQARVKDVQVVERDGRLWVATRAGDPLVPAEDWVRALHAAHREQDAHGILYRVLNITTPWSLVWIAIGFAGQALFTLRMLLQWWASEKEKRSVVPIAFWWGSLGGGILLLLYFVWRKDVVGVVGQSTGVFVYARNLVLIHRNRTEPPAERTWSATSSPPHSPMPTGRSTSAT